MRYGTRQRPPSTPDRRAAAGGRGTLRHAAGAFRDRSIPIARLAASSRIRHVPIRAVVLVLRTRIDQSTWPADRRSQNRMAHCAVRTLDAAPHARPALGTIREAPRHSDKARSIYIHGTWVCAQCRFADRVESADARKPSTLF